MEIGTCGIYGVVDLRGVIRVATCPVESLYTDTRHPCRVNSTPDRWYGHRTVDTCEQFRTSRTQGSAEVGPLFSSPLQEPWFQLSPPPATFVPPDSVRGRFLAATPPVDFRQIPTATSSKPINRSNITSGVASLFPPDRHRLLIDGGIPSLTLSSSAQVYYRCSPDQQTAPSYSSYMSSDMASILPKI